MTEKIDGGFIRICNEISEALATINLSAYESRIIWVIFRKTYGWNKKEDLISLEQFKELTGMQKTHICRTLKKLLTRKIVTQTGNKYSFNKSNKEWRELPKQVTVKTLPKQVIGLPKQVIKITQTGNLKSSIASNTIKKTTPKDKKDTITKERGEKFSPPTIEDIANYSKERGHKVDAEKIFYHYETLDWKNAKGKQVSNWKNTVSNNWFNKENKIVSENEQLKKDVQNFIKKYSMTKERFIKCCKSGTITDSDVGTYNDKVTMEFFKLQTKIIK